MKFRTQIILGGKTATGFEVPAAIVTKLGSGKRPPVRVTINGFTYRSTIAVFGEKFFLPLSAENRAGAGVSAGATVDIDVELDTVPREVTVPPDFKTALARDATASKHFESLSYSAKRAFTLPIEQAKTEETRQRRIEKAISTLRAGRK